MKEAIEIVMINERNFKPTNNDIDFFALSDATLALLHTFLFVAHKPPSNIECKKDFTSILQRVHTDLVGNNAHYKHESVSDSFIGQRVVTVKILLDDSREMTYLLTPDMYQQCVDIMQHVLKPPNTHQMDVANYRTRFDMNLIGGIENDSIKCMKDDSFGGEIPRMISSQTDFLSDVTVEDETSTFFSGFGNLLFGQPGIVAVEVPQNDSTLQTIYFTPHMYNNFSDIMRRRIPLVLATSGERISEINSVMDLFSYNWFRGDIPISTRSLIWDFRRENNSTEIDENVSADISTDESTFPTISSESANDISLNDSISSIISSTETGSTNSSFNYSSSTESDSNYFEAMSQNILDAKLVSLYKNGNAN